VANTTLVAGDNFVTGGSGANLMSRWGTVGALPSSNAGTTLGAVTGATWALMLPPAVWVVNWSLFNFVCTGAPDGGINFQFSNNEGVSWTLVNSSSSTVCSPVMSAFSTSGTTNMQLFGGFRFLVPDDGTIYYFRATSPGTAGGTTFGDTVMAGSSTTAAATLCCTTVFPNPTELILEETDASFATLFRKVAMLEARLPVPVPLLLEAKESKTLSVCPEDDGEFERVKRQWPAPSFEVTKVPATPVKKTSQKSSG